MKSTTLVLPTLLTLAASQNVTVPTTCEGDLTAGTDTALFTVPYTYAQVLSIIGSYQNLTWSGNPPDTVKLNGSDNTVGTARTYMLAGATIIETLLTYDSPPGGPYYENHNVALLTIQRPASAGGNISTYFPLDATTVTSVCDGKATMFNFTANFCSNNVTAAGPLIHELHTGDAMTVGKFLGGQNFTSCEALGAGNSSATSTATAPVSTFTGAAAKFGAGAAVAGLAGFAMLL